MLYNFFEKNKLVFVYLPLIVYWIVLFLATTLPAHQVPKTGINDKIEHLLGYFLLTFLLNNSLYFQNKLQKLKQFPIIASLSIVTFYGMIDELHQLFIPGRLCDFYDWTADVLGGVIACVLYFIIKKFFLFQSTSLES